MREVAKEGLEKREAVFEQQGEEPESGEARAGGPSSPAAEAVFKPGVPAQNYVDDRQARRTLKAFNRVPGERARVCGPPGTARAAAATSP